MMQRPWELAAADEWLPLQLRLTFGGPPGDSDSGGTPSGDSLTGDGNFSFDSGGPPSSDSGFQSTSSDSQSTDGGGFQSTSSGYSSDSGNTYSGDSGGYYSYSGTDGGQTYGGDQGGGYLGGSSLGGSLSADAGYLGGGGGGGGGPYGGGGGFAQPTGGGFADSTTGQGFGLFGSQNADPNQAQNLGPPSITGNDLSAVANAMRGGDLSPTDLASQLGYQNIGQNLASQQTNATVDAQLQAAQQQAQSQDPAQQQANQTGDQLASDIAAALGRDTTGVNQFQNITAPLDLTSPVAPAYSPYSPSESLTGQPTAPFGGRSQSGMDMDFNPFGNYQAPAAPPNQGTQGLQGGRSEAPSLLDMLNPVSTANAGWLISETGRSAPAERGTSDFIAETGPGTGRGLSQQAPNELNTTTLNDLATQFGRDPATITNLLNNAPYEGPFGGPDVVGDRTGQDPANTSFVARSDTPGYYPYSGPFGGPDVVGDRSQSQAPPTLDEARGGVTQAQVQDAYNQAAGREGESTRAADPRAADFDSRFGDLQQQSQQQTMPSWMNPAELMSGVRGGQELFAQAPQNLNEALQAARSGDPNVMAPPFAQMPWGTTFAPPTAYPAWNAAQQLEGVRGTDLLTPLQDQLFNPQTVQDRQAAIERAFPTIDRPDVPLPRDNPIPFAQRGYDVLPQARPQQETQQQQSRQQQSRQDDRAPTRVTVNPERSGPPLTSRSTQTQTQSRSGSQSQSRSNSFNQNNLNSLLAAARDPNTTMQSRIAALDQLNGIISAMRAAGLPNPFGRDPDANISGALRMGR